MEYTVLGKTGLKISRMGFGGIPIQRVDRETARTLTHRLLEAGVNYIDTARGYTVSEELIGQAIEGYRKDFVLATKSMSRDRDSMARSNTSREWAVTPKWPIFPASLASSRASSAPPGAQTCSSCCRLGLWT